MATGLLKGIYSQSQNNIAALSPYFQDHNFWHSDCYVATFNIHSSCNTPQSYTFRLLLIFSTLISPMFTSLIFAFSMNLKQAFRFSILCCSKLGFLCTPIIFSLERLSSSCTSIRPSFRSVSRFSI